MRPPTRRCWVLSHSAKACKAGLIPAGVGARRTPYSGLPTRVATRSTGGDTWAFCSPQPGPAAPGPLFRFEHDHAVVLAARLTLAGQRAGPLVSWISQPGGAAFPPSSSTTHVYSATHHASGREGSYLAPWCKPQPGTVLPARATYPVPDYT
jgi:hypothetical protein